jgi:hypothetical protein
MCFRAVMGFVALYRLFVRSLALLDALIGPVDGPLTIACTACTAVLAVNVTEALVLTKMIKTLVAAFNAQWQPALGALNISGTACQIGLKFEPMIACHRPNTILYKSGLTSDQ